MQLNCDPSINAWIIANLNECEDISCSSLSFSLVVVVVLFCGALSAARLRLKLKSSNVLI